MSQGSIIAGIVVPRLPHPLLAPEKNAGWARLREAYGKARADIAALEPDLLLVYSAGWPSIIGHQVLNDPNPRWKLVDQDFHDLGTMDYSLSMDPAFGELFEQTARARGLQCRTVAYHGFPVDTGTVTAMMLLNPDNAYQGSAVSCNMYADRAETVVLGKAARDAIERSGKRVVVIAATGLSNRLFTHDIPHSEDRIHSLKDDEWNQKILEFFAEGRLEDVSQLARQFTREANADNRFKAIWWLAAVMGQSNNYKGKVYAYEPIWGTGAAVIGLTPSTTDAADLEFDEADVDVYRGDRGVLSTNAADGTPDGQLASVPPQPTTTNPTATGGQEVRTNTAPKPVGAYPHARREGEFIFVSGMGPRQPGTDAIPGGPICDAEGKPLDYDIRAQTRAVIENIRAVLEAAGSSLDEVVDCTCFLIDMGRDFKGFNEVYGELLGPVGPTRTTMAITALPTPIAVELKVIARAKG